MNTSTRMPQPDRMIAVTTAEIAELTLMGATLVQLSEQHRGAPVTLWAGGEGAVVICHREAYFGHDPSWNNFTVNGRSEGNRWGALEKVADLTIDALAARPAPADAALILSETDIRSFVRMGAYLAQMGEDTAIAKMGIWAGGSTVAEIARRPAQHDTTPDTAFLLINDAPAGNRWDALHIYNSLALDALYASAQPSRLALAA